jgi:hypothetical protein
MVAIILVLGSLAAAKAQVLKIGPKVGANLVKVNAESFSSVYDLGYHVGAFVEVRLGSKWYLQPELLFNQTKLSRSNSFKDIYNNFLRFDSLRTIKLQTLSIPLTINWKLANVLALSAGPQFSLVMDREASLVSNVGKTFSRGDLALVGGANLLLGKFRMSGRYAVGLNNLNDLGKQDAWRSQTLQLGMGFVF